MPRLTYAEAAPGGTLAPSRAAIFTPLSLGAALHDLWDAERAGDIDLSGAAVTAWRSAKNGWAAVQVVGAARPLYGAASFNGRPGVTFDGADDELTYVGSLGSLPIGLAAGEIWCLIDQRALPADTTARYPAAYGGVSFSSNRGLRRSVASGVNRIGAITGATATQALNTAADASGRLVCRVVFDGTNKRVDINGVAGATAAAENTGSADRVRIGAAASTPAGGFMNGPVSLIAITAPLSAPQATQMLAYLKIRGGIA